MLLGIFALLILPAPGAPGAAAAGGGTNAVCKICNTSYDCNHPNGANIKQNGVDKGDHNIVICDLTSYTCGSAISQCVQQHSECEWTDAPSGVVAYPNGKKYKVLDHTECHIGTIGCGAYDAQSADFENTCWGSRDQFVTFAQKFYGSSQLVTFFSGNGTAATAKITNNNCAARYYNANYGYFSAKDSKDACSGVQIATRADTGY